MIAFRPLVLLTILASAAGGCATVAVYEPVDAAEIAFAQPNAELREAADKYCEAARERGVARGESTLGGLTGALLGKDSPADLYWAKISSEGSSATEYAVRVGADLGAASGGLNELVGLAAEVVETGSPRRTDVSKFESALIHARQARQSLSGAIDRIGGDAGEARHAELARELGALDSAIELAVATADRLAEARLSREVS